MDLDEAIAQIGEIPAAYVLLCQNGKLYKGACRYLAERLRDHRAGRVLRTKGQRPLKLVYYEVCQDYTVALQREKFFKSGVGRGLLKQQLLAPNIDLLPGWRNWQTQQT